MTRKVPEACWTQIPLPTEVTTPIAFVRETRAHRESPGATPARLHLRGGTVSAPSSLSICLHVFYKPGSVSGLPAGEAPLREEEQDELRGSLSF